MKSMEEVRKEYMTPKRGKSALMSGLAAGASYYVGTIVHELIHAATAAIGGGEAREIILNEKYYWPLSPLEKLTDGFIQIGPVEKASSMGEADTVSNGLNGPLPAYSSGIVTNNVSRIHGFLIDIMPNLVLAGAGFYLVRQGIKEKNPVKVMLGAPALLSPVLNGPDYQNGAYEIFDAYRHGRVGVNTSLEESGILPEEVKAAYYGVKILTVGAGIALGYAACKLTDKIKKPKEN